MEAITIARALHVLSVVHWIGGVFMVTAVILPAVRRLTEPSRQLALFEAVESRFATQARVSVTLAGASGLYMAYRLDAWDRFLDPGYWWMHAMVLIWAIFTIMLFIAEPFFLHDAFRARAQKDPEGTLASIQRLHWVLLSLSLVTVGAAVLGAHGMLF